MDENLIPNEDPKVEDEKVETVEQEFEIEYTTRLDYIQGAYFSLSAVDDIDVALMNKEDEKRIKRIRRKSLKIIDECLNELYDEIFESDEDDSQ
jgi:hypothetical protein